MKLKIIKTFTKNLRIKIKNQKNKEQSSNINNS